MTPEEIAERPFSEQIALIHNTGRIIAKGLKRELEEVGGDEAAKRTKHGLSQLLVLAASTLYNMCNPDPESEDDDDGEVEIPEDSIPGTMVREGNQYCVSSSNATMYLMVGKNDKGQNVPVQAIADKLSAGTTLIILSADTGMGKTHIATAGFVLGGGPLNFRVICPEAAKPAWEEVVASSTGLTVDYLSDDIIKSLFHIPTGSANHTTYSKAVLNVGYAKRILTNHTLVFDEYQDNLQASSSTMRPLYGMLVQAACQHPDWNTRVVMIGFQDPYKMYSDKLSTRVANVKAEALFELLGLTFAAPEVTGWTEEDLGNIAILTKSKPTWYRNVLLNLAKVVGSKPVPDLLENIINFHVLAETIECLSVAWDGNHALFTHLDFKIRTVISSGTLKIRTEPLGPAESLALVKKNTEDDRKLVSSERAKTIVAIYKKINPDPATRAVLVGDFPSNIADIMKYFSDLHVYECTKGIELAGGEPYDDQCPTLFVMHTGQSVATRVKILEAFRKAAAPLMVTHISCIQSGITLSTPDRPSLVIMPPCVTGERTYNAATRIRRINCKEPALAVIAAFTDELEGLHKMYENKLADITLDEDDVQDYERARGLRAVPLYMYEEMETGILPIVKPTVKAKQEDMTMAIIAKLASKK